MEPILQSSETPLAQLFEVYPLPWYVDDNRPGDEGMVTVCAANKKPVMEIADMEGADWPDLLLASLMGAAPGLYMGVANLLAIRDQLIAVDVESPSELDVHLLLAQVESTCAALRDVLAQASKGTEFDPLRATV